MYLGTSLDRNKNAVIQGRNYLAQVGEEFLVLKAYHNIGDDEPQISGQAILWKESVFLAAIDDSRVRWYPKDIEEISPIYPGVPPGKRKGKQV
jgi:hypothetical protein